MYVTREEYYNIIFFSKNGHSHDHYATASTVLSVLLLSYASEKELNTVLHNANNFVSENTTLENIMSIGFVLHWLEHENR